MAGRLLPRMFDVALDANGNPLAGAKLYTYVNTTTTLKATYTTSALSVPQANPIVADSAGRFPDIWADDNQTFRVKLTDAAGAQIFQADDMITLGSNPSGAISRDFGADGRFAINASGGTANFEGGDPSPDNTGGKVRLGGWNNTQADTAEIDAAATTITGTAAIAGAATVGGSIGVTGAVTATGAGTFGGDFHVGGVLTLADGSVVSNPISPIITSGRYYVADPIIYASPGDTVVLTPNQIYWVPFSRGITSDAIAFLISVGGAVVGNARLGLYTSSVTTGLPNTLVEGSAAISTNSTGTKVAVFGANHIIAGRYWLALLSDAAPTIQCATNGGVDSRMFGQSALATHVAGKYSTFAYAALPATAPVITGDLVSVIPYTALRAA